jgi:hypothetical protein
MLLLSEREMGDAWQASNSNALSEIGEQWIETNFNLFLSLKD